MALKLLLAGGPEMASRVAREAQHLAALHHPGVVRYVAHGALADAGEADDARLVHAEALHRSGDLDGARAAITAARARLLARAELIAEAEVKEAFVACVPENARTLALAASWTGE